MENKMETTIVYRGFTGDIYIYIFDFMVEHGLVGVTVLGPGLLTSRKVCSPL